jgi:hypothetical protein
MATGISFSPVIFTGCDYAAAFIIDRTGPNISQKDTQEITRHRISCRCLCRATWIPTAELTATVVKAMLTSVSGASEFNLDIVRSLPKAPPAVIAQSV